MRVRYGITYGLRIAIYDFTDDYNSDPDTYNHYSAGINMDSVGAWDTTVSDFIGHDPRTRPIALTNLTIKNCNFNNNFHNFFNSVPDANVNSSGFADKDNGYCHTQIKYMTVDNIYTTNSQVEGFVGSFLNNSIVKNSTFLKTGVISSSSYPGGGAGVDITWSSDVVVDNCIIRNVDRVDGHKDGAGFDFEGHNYNITLKNSTIESTYGAGIMIYHSANSSLGNINTLIENVDIKWFGIHPYDEGNNNGLEFFEGCGSGVARNVNLYTYNGVKGVDGDYREWYFENVNEYTDERPQKWLFDSQNDPEFWSLNNMTGAVSNGTYKLNITSSDPYMNSGKNLNYNADDYYTVKVKMKNNTSSTEGKIYWKRTVDSVHGESRSKTFSINVNDTNSTIYTIDLSSEQYYSGTISDLRLDPTAASTGSVEIDYIEVVRTGTKPEPSPVPILPDGNNLAALATITVSGTGASSTNASYDASYLNDGYVSPYFVDTSRWKHWASQAGVSSSSPAWVELDFGTQKTFNEVQLYTMNNGFEQKEYTIQYWDGSSWVNCLNTITNNDQSRRYHKFSSVTSNKMRIYMTQGNQSQSGTARLSEIEVYLNQDNLARYATISASSASSGYNYDDIIDGITDPTSWNGWSTNSLPAWVQLDFEDTQEINKVDLYLTQGSSYTQKEYKVEYWNGSSWNECVSQVTNNTQSYKTHTFDTVTTDKVRVYMTQGSTITSNSARLVEVELYGPENINRQSKVSASSTATGNLLYNEQYVNNGSKDTWLWSGWSTGTKPAWIEYDLGSSETFNRLELYTKENYELQRYKLQYWNGSIWVDCFTEVMNNTSEHRTHTFADVAAQKVRIYMDSTSQSGTVRLTEVELYKD